MHKSVYNFVNRVASEFSLTDEKKTILEIGSLDINGSVRPIFSGKYTGLDMQDGQGVDVVMNANDAAAWVTNFGKRKFDVIINSEAMEHDLCFWKTWENAVKYLKKDGLYIVTTRGIGFHYHPFPSDYYRFTTDSFRDLAGLFGLEAVLIEEDPQTGHPGAFGVFKLKA